MASYTPQEGIRATVKALQQGLVRSLRSIYVYGSLAQSHYDENTSNVNLLVVVANGASIHDVRQAYLPVWWRYRTVLRSAPLLAQEDSIGRHLILNPIFTNHLRKVGNRIFGEPLALPEQRLSVSEGMSRLLLDAMTASQALCPSLMPEDDAAEANRLLYRLARRLGYKNNQRLGAAKIFAFVHHRLAQGLSRLPNDFEVMPQADAPADIPTLQTMYVKDDQLVMVFPKLTPELIIETDWERVASQVENQCTGLMITTPQQLDLIAKFEHPMELLLLNYQHEWGDDFLNGSVPSRRLVLRQAARLPTELEISGFAGQYLTSEDTEVSMLIHDFQNRLLNIQLRHELLVRLQHAVPATPTHPLPGRDEREDMRVSAIFDHTNWWSTYYTNSMSNYE
jgi:hypothetical protein